MEDKIEKVKYSEDIGKVIELSEKRTVQLYIDGVPFGSVYTIGEGRKAYIVFRIDVTDA